MPEIPPDLVLELACVGGAVSVLLGVAGLLARGATVARFRTAVGLLVTLFLTGCAAGALSAQLTAWPFLLMGACSAGLTLLGSGWAGQAATAARRLVGHGRLHAGLLLAAGPVFLFWAFHQADAVAPPDVVSSLDVSGCDATRVQEAEFVHPFTDRGTPVHVYVPKPEALAVEPLLAREAALVKDLGLAQKMIRTAPPDALSNCHGWVFTGGRFCVPGSEVDLILQENGYVKVTEPRPDDVAVYRDEQGTVLHTGVVRSAPADGTVLIESKWGWLGRYVHKPQDQVYGTNVGYYRSPRPDNLIHGLGGETPPDVSAED
jgi:hypothetical protein